MTEQELAEILTLTCEVDKLGNIKYRNSAGKKHRIHGPAVIWSDGGESWWLDGHELTEGQFNERVKPI